MFGTSRAAKAVLNGFAGKRWHKHEEDVQELTLRSGATIFAERRDIALGERTNIWPCATLRSASETSVKRQRDELLGPR